MGGTRRSEPSRLQPREIDLVEPMLGELGGREDLQPSGTAKLAQAWRQGTAIRTHHRVDAPSPQAIGFQGLDQGFLLGKGKGHLERAEALAHDFTVLPAHDGDPAQRPAPHRHAKAGQGHGHHGADQHSQEKLRRQRRSTLDRQHAEENRCSPEKEDATHHDREKHVTQPIVGARSVEPHGPADEDGAQRHEGGDDTCGQKVMPLRGAVGNGDEAEHQCEDRQHVRDR
jgi:hypothetical protein